MISFLLKPHLLSDEQRDGWPGISVHAFPFFLPVHFPPCRNLTALKPLSFPFLPFYHNCCISEVKGVSLAFADLMGITDDEGLCELAYR